MTLISRYACNHCGFELPIGDGRYTYAVDNDGRRVYCPHPGEIRKMQEVTGLGYGAARDAGRVGFADHCVCLDCVQRFDLDLERDSRACPECASAQIRALRELIDQNCPKCKVGIIEQGSLVRWQLDPDWEQLPVPQVVKELTQYANARRELHPVALQQAIEIISERNFFVLVLTLLGWWEGNYFLEDKEQHDSLEMSPRATWCKVLPAVLEVTPSLAELVAIREGRCWFADGVSSDVRRGIKNYLRKHRKHVVISQFLTLFKSLVKFEGVSHVATDPAKHECTFWFDKSNDEIKAKLDELAKTNDKINGYERLNQLKASVAA